MKLPDLTNTLNKKQLSTLSDVMQVFLGENPLFKYQNYHKQINLK